MTFSNSYAFKAILTLFMIFSTPLFFQVNAQQQILKLKKTDKSQATYITDTGGDLDKLITRKPTVDEVGRFIIKMTGELPQNTAKLSINAYDIDEERGETVKIYFNEHYAGKLSGTNDTWSTTLLDIRKEWIKKGRNNVRFIVSDTSKSGTIKWSGKVDWGQLLIDGGAHKKGTITHQSITYKERKNVPKALSQIDIISKKPGDFRLEVSILDAKANSIASKVNDFSLDTEGPHTESVNIRLLNSIPIGKYNILTHLFYRENKTWVQQDYQVTHWENKVEKQVKPELRITSPIKDIMLEEDALKTKINLLKVFTVVDINKESSPSLGIEKYIKKTILENSNKDLVSAVIKDNQLILEYMPNKYGEATIRILGKYKNQKISDVFHITITDVDDPPIVSQPLNDVLVDENASDTKIDLSHTFYDPDDKRQNILKRIKSNTNPKLVTTKITGNELILSYAENSTGNADIVIEGFSNTQSTDTRFKVIVYPVQKKEINSVIDGDLFFGNIFISNQNFGDYDNATSLTLGVGRELGSLLKGLAIEFDYSKTINRHEKHLSLTNNDGSTSYTTAKMDINTYSFFMVYEFFRQIPERYSLFKDNPLRIRAKLGYSILTYTLNDLPDKYDGDDLDDDLRSETSSLSYGIEVAAKFQNKLESFVELKQITSHLSNISMGARIYF